nr:hypothetical protein [Tanacetum cinerariifolium]
TNAAEVEADSFISSAGTIRSDAAGPSHLPGKVISMGSREIREMDYHHLFTDFNVGTAHQACLNAKIMM